MDTLIATYLAVFFAINFWFLALSAVRVRRLLVREQLRPPTRDRRGVFLPPLTLLVPAYNEEVTCEDSVRSLLRLDYPCYEVIICNDGSKDRTVEVLKHAFGFVRTDVNYNPVLATAPVRGLYQATCPLPPNVRRLILIDKANGGKADALNAAINAAEACSYRAWMPTACSSPMRCCARCRPSSTTRRGSSPSAPRSVCRTAR